MRNVQTYSNVFESIPKYTHTHLIKQYYYMPLSKYVNLRLRSRPRHRYETRPRGILHPRARRVIGILADERRPPVQSEALQCIQSDRGIKRRVEVYDRR